MKRKPSTVVAIVVVLAILAVIGSQLKPGDKVQAAAAANDNCTMAFVISKGFVQNELKYAQFSFPGEHKCDQKPNGDFRVTSYTEAYISKGEVVKVSYQMVLRYKGGSNADPNNWEMIDFKTQ